MTIPSESDLVDDLLALSGYQSLKRNGTFPEILLLIAVLRIASVAGGGGGGSTDMSGTHQRIGDISSAAASSDTANASLNALLKRLLTKLQSTANGLKVDNSGVTQPISGTLDIGNFPLTQVVDGTVSIDNFPSTQTVAGIVGITNFPTTQAVSGNFATQTTLESVLTKLSDPATAAKQTELNTAIATLLERTPAFATTAHTVTIASGASVSNVIDLNGKVALSIQTPVAWSGTNPYMSFEVSNDNTTFVSLRVDGSEYTFPTGPSFGHVLVPWATRSWRYIKVRSGTATTANAQTAERVFTLNSGGI